MDSSVPPWTVQLSNSTVKSIRHYRADKAVIENYRRFVEELKYSENPEAEGVRKKGRHRHCIGTHLTKSVVLVYRINHAAHRIDLLDMGDHKTVYGRDG